MDTDSTRPIFIGGHHRSGTTLLRVMLNRHPHIACGPESELLERTRFIEFHRYLEDTWLPQLEGYGLGQYELDRAVAAFMDSFFTRYQLQRGKHRWAEKTPKNIFRIAYLFRLFPDAQFIHMVRDPRDVHCSVREKARTTTPRWSGITAERTARSWTKRVSRGLDWRADPRYLEVRYEDLACDPMGTMQVVLRFLREPWDERVLQADPATREEFVHANVNRPIFSTSVGRWHDELPMEDLEQIEAVAGALMSQLGYELSTGVAPAPISSSGGDADMVGRDHPVPSAGGTSEMPHRASHPSLHSIPKR